MLEFTIVYSQYDFVESMIKKQVAEYQNYIDAIRHIDIIFESGVHEISIGCRPARLTREDIYNMLLENYQEMSEDDNNINYENEE